MSDNNKTVGRRTFLKATGGVTTVGVAGLAGCAGGDGGSGGDGGDGSSGGDGGSSGDQSGGSTSQNTKPITIASTLPRTGAFSDFADDLEIGYDLGIQAMNDAGGIDGRQVEIVIGDDESEAKKVSDRLQQIVSENDVQMIWGSFSSLLATAGSAFAEQNGLPFLATSFGSEAPHLRNDYQWTFAPFPKSRDQAASGIATLQNLDPKPTNIGIWELNSSWGAEQADAWANHVEGTDFEIVMREKYSIGTKDFSSLISKSESAGVEALLSNPIPPDGIAAVKQMKSSGWAPKALHFIRAADANSWWSALGDTGAYVLISPGWLPGLTGGGNKDFLKRYDAMKDKPADRPYVLMGASYGLAQTAHQAMSAADSAEPAAIRDALLSETFDTVVGKFAFEDNGMPVEGQITGPIGQWWQGKQRLVYPETDSDYAMKTKYPIPPWSDR